MADLACYVVLVRLTPDALNTIEEAPDRLRKPRSVLSEEGVDLEKVYLTLGQYDGVIVASTPDDATVARTILKGGREWVLETETLRAFPEEEFRGIVGDVSEDPG